MTEQSIKSIVNSLDKYTGSERQHLISGYEYDTFDPDALVTMPASFFAELLKNEKDDICKWYEVKALGEWRASEYADLIFNIIMQDNVIINQTSLHLIAAGALGKMGKDIISKCDALLSEATGDSTIALIDALGETHCVEAIPSLVNAVGKATTKEFAYIVLALSKCGDEGAKELQKLFFEVPEDRQFAVIDALGRSVNNDTFLISICHDYHGLFVKSLSHNTYGITLLKDRIISNVDNWPDNITTILKEEVNTNE